MARQPTVRRHDYEAKHGKSKFIACLITNNNHGNIELNVNRLTATLFSNFGARKQQATTGYKCNQGHEWIEHDIYIKTSLVNISRLCIELLVAAGLHSNKI